MRLQPSFLAFLVPALTLSDASDAAIIAFTQRSVWDAFAAANGASRSTETFSSYSGPYLTDLSGTTGGVQWLAEAPGGVEVGTAAGSAALSTIVPSTLTLTFGGASVRGIGTNVFGTDSSFGIVPIVVRFVLSDGTNIVRSMSSATSFVGVWSTGSAITSIQILPETSALSGAVAFATIDDLTFAVIPGPAAGLTIAALAVRPNRRRS